MAADLTDAALPPIIGSIGTMTVSLLGLPPLPLFVAFCGASLGLLFAPSVGRWKAMLAFPFVWILAAEIGTWIAHLKFPGDVGAQLTACGLLGLFFHPLIGLGLNRIKAHRAAAPKETP